MTDSKGSTDFNQKDTMADITNLSQSGGISDQPDKQKNTLADNVGNIVHGDATAVKDIFKQAKESTGGVADKAYNVAAKKTSSKIDEQKADLASGLTNVADNIRQMGDSLLQGEKPHGIAALTADYSHTLADKVESLSSYLGEKDLRELAKDIEKFAHRNPALFLGGAFALGVAAARFLKSGNSDQRLARRPRYEIDGKYMPDEHEGVHLPEDLDKLSENAAANTTSKSASAASSNKGA